MALVPQRTTARRLFNTVKKQSKKSELLTLFDIGFFEFSTLQICQINLKKQLTDLPQDCRRHFRRGFRGIFHIICQIFNIEIGIYSNMKMRKQLTFFAIFFL